MTTSLSTLKTLTRNQVVAAVESIKNGQFVRVTYQSEVPLKAENKKAGYKVVKVTECTGRLGVDYDNISSVKERKAMAVAPAREVKNNYTWVIENKIAYNSNTKGEYLRITTTPNANTKKKFLITKPDGSIEEIEDLKAHANYSGLPINSYWSPKAASEVRNIKIENIIKISDYGKSVAF